MMVWNSSVYASKTLLRRLLDAGFGAWLWPGWGLVGVWFGAWFGAWLGIVGMTWFWPGVGVVLALLWPSFGMVLASFLASVLLIVA